MIKKSIIIFLLFISLKVYSEVALIFSPGAGVFNNFSSSNKELGWSLPFELKLFLSENVKAQWGLLLGVNPKLANAENSTATDQSDAGNALTYLDFPYISFPLGIILKTEPVDRFQAEISTGGLIEHSFDLARTRVYFNVTTGLGYRVSELLALNYRTYFTFKDDFEISNLITFDIMLNFK